MAGHSAWKNIKHRKAAADAKRGKAWSKCARAIIVAARTGGGDPDANITLRAAIDDARAENMPRDTIEKAIKKGTGELQSESYESAMYEGYGPAGVALIIEILTNNRNRTSPEIKRIFDDYGGNLGGPGSVSYMFRQMGQVLIPRGAADEDTVMAAVLDAGADDVSLQGDQWRVLCQPNLLAALRLSVEGAKLPVDAVGLTMVPTLTVPVNADDAQRVLGLLEALDDHDDVQKVYANFEIPDDVLAAMK